MAIIQISKIQQRSGNLVDLPQLDEAQFGWATDAKRLFIGKTTPNENIEVLTSYSNISFSQIDGSDGGNFNIGNATNGQTLTYVALTNTWENWTGNASQLGNAKLQLGDASNVSIEGGATGYILETDGTGNLTWTSKGTLRTEIVALSNATPIVMTVDANANVPYVNSLPVTISGANAANANTIVNGQTFYIKVAVDFPTSGNVELFLTQDLAPGNGAVGTNLGSYTANSGIATALISGGGVSNAGGSVNTIQFNNSGILDGSANFTLTGGNLVTLTGNFIANNIDGGNLVTANYFNGTLTTAAQPNITSTGTLASLSVSGNANIGNIGTAGLITATGNITGGNLITAGLISATGNANVANINVTGHIIPTANITYDLGNSTNWFRDLYLSGTSIKLGSQTVTSNALGVALSNAVFTTTLSSTGNANIGNIGTAGLVTATGNIRGGNLITPGLISATGNVNAGNVNATRGSFTNIAGEGGNISNIQAANISGAVSTATTATTVDITNTNGLTTVYYPTFVENRTTGQIVRADVDLTYRTDTNTLTTANLSVTGNVISTLLTGTLTTASQPNITSTGTLASLSVSGNANVGNLGTAQVLATANVTSPRFISNVTTGTSPLSVSSTTLVSNLNADLLDGYNTDTAGNANTVVVRDTNGGITANNISGNSIFIAPGQVDPSNVTAFAAGQVNEVTTGFNAPGIVMGASVGQHGAIVYASNIMYFGTETGSDNTMGIRAQLDSNSAFTVNTVIATSLSTGNSATAGNITGNWTLTSGSRFQATYADLAEYYEADQHYEPGTVLEFGGEKEVTLAQDGTTRVAGVVTTNPAYVMNTNCPGIAVAIALQGRVPVKVRGKVHKGDLMVSAGNGYARPWNNAQLGMIIGKAIQNFDDIEGIIEVAIGRL